MKPIYEEWTIVVVGNWNPAIFSPKWVGKKLFDLPQIAGQYTINPRFVGIRYHTEDHVIIPSPEKLIIGVKNGKNETLVNAEKVIEKVLDLLSHTPVDGLGFNFVFEETENISDIVGMFNFQDQTAIFQNLDNCQIAKSEIQRSFGLGDHILNLKLTKTESKLTFNFNFHHSGKSATELKDILTGKFWDYSLKAKEIAENVYNLQMEEEANDG